MQWTPNCIVEEIISYIVVVIHFYLISVCAFSISLFTDPVKGIVYKSDPGRETSCLPFFQVKVSAYPPPRMRRRVIF